MSCRCCRCCTAALSLCAASAFVAVCFMVGFLWKDGKDDEQVSSRRLSRTHPTADRVAAVRASHGVAVSSNPLSAHRRAALSLWAVRCGAEAGATVARTRRAGEGAQSSAAQRRRAAARTDLFPSRSSLTSIDVLLASPRPLSPATAIRVLGTAAQRGTAPLPIQSDCSPQVDGAQPLLPPSANDWTGSGRGREERWTQQRTCS